MAKFDLGDLRDKIQDAVEARKGDDNKSFEPLMLPDANRVSVRSALKIVYYLMAVDGTIYHGEEAQYDLIGRELDPGFVYNKGFIIGECAAQLSKATSMNDYYYVIANGVESALSAPHQANDTFISPKLLLWDLLTIAYSDGGYDAAEQRLIRHVVDKTGVDKAVFLEMESSLLTMMDIEKELAWIKSTNRPYDVTDSVVKELTKRKSAIYESIKDLISM